MWLWQDDRFKILNSAPTFESAILSFGWCPSRAAAQKAIKLGEVQFKKAPGKWIKVKDYKEPIPAGWPVVINFKNRPWMWHEVMVPAPGQGIRSWTRIWNEQPIGWWADFLDRLENFKNWFKQ